MAFCSATLHCPNRCPNFIPGHHDGEHSDLRGQIVGENKTLGEWSRLPVRHNRDELLGLVADEVLRQSPPLRGDVGDLWVAITKHTIGIQELFDEYAGLDVVVMQRSPSLAVSKQVRSDFVRLLEAHGISSPDARHVQRSVTWLWLGARISLGGRPQKPSERAQFARALDELIAALRFNSWR